MMFFKDKKSKVVNPMGEKAPTLEAEKTSKTQNSPIHLASPKSEQEEINALKKEIAALQQENSILRQTLAQYRSYIDNLNATIVTLSPEMKITYASPNWTSLLGHELSEVINQSPMERFIHPEDVPKNLEYLRQILKSGKSSGEIEYRIQHKDGSWKWHAAYGSVICAEAGEVQSYLIIASDISERKAAEQQLKQSEARFRLLIENMSEGVIIVDNDDVVQYINRSCCDIYGFNYLDVLGKVGYEHLIAEEDRHKILEKNSLRIEGVSDNYEVRGKKVTGELIWLKIKGTPLRNEAGVVIGSVGIMTDITERKKIESEKLNLLNIIDSSLNEIYIFDAETLKFDYLNLGALKNTGYSMEEMRQMTPLDIKPDFNLNTFVSMLDSLQSGEVGLLQFETTHKRKDGTTYPAEVHLQLHKHLDKAKFLAVINDATESKSLREQLLASQKMDAIGKLAGGIAHDFNNLLTVILGYGEELLDTLPPESNFIMEVEEIVKAGTRASNLTRQLLTFSRKQVVQPRILNVNELIVNLQNMLQHLLGVDIVIQTKPADDLEVIKTDIGQFEQIIVNLALNARDAMPKGGKLTIETANLTVGQDFVRSNIEVKPGKYVVLAITDTGCGMDKETQGRIFEPFFTTKAAGKGLGLGLSTVYGIVKQAEGSIIVHSEPGAGTCIKILLPTSSASAAVNQPPSIARDMMGKGEHILIVEDEVPLLNFLSKLIRNIGYKVSSKSSSIEALELIQHGLKPDLIITDVIMPVLNGKDLADRIKKILPSPRVLFMSGFSDESVMPHGVLEDGVPYIQKPFTAKEIAQKIHDLLADDTKLNTSAEILMLDDEDSLRTLMQRVCTRRGHSFTGAANLEDALLALSQKKFDVLLVDMHLFCMDGVHALEQIRKAGITTPAIVFSGAINPEEREALKPLGVVKIVEKAISNLPLLQLIDDILAGKIKVN